MSRAAPCLLALGLGLSLAAACGDDDVAVINTGGTSGGGSAGAAGGGSGGGGAGGSAGTVGGSGGAAGVAGDGAAGNGAANNGGAAGSDAAGSGGAAGAGGGGPADAGADAALPTDAGSGAACPADLDDLEAGPTAGATTSTETQEVIITRVVFDGDDLVVTFRGAIETGFNFAEPLVLCTGSEPSDCDGGVAELEGTGSGDVDGGVAGNLLPTEEQSYRFEDALVGGATSAASGEVALVNGLDPNALMFPENAFVRAYVNWGDYPSLEPLSQEYDSLEVRAVAGGVWALDESVEVGQGDTLFATGDVTSASGFESCSAN